MSSEILESIDHETIALVWSFRDTIQEIPYRISYNESTNTHGKKSVYWRCTCPAFTKRRGYTCKHLTTLKEEVKEGIILSDDRYRITSLGKKILKIE